jgi:hypothetical protein
VRIRVTPSARRELLETVVQLRGRDREEAARFVLELEDRLMAVADGIDDAPELGSVWHTAGAAEGHRVYVRERGDVLWLLAVWPEDRGSCILPM